MSDETELNSQLRDGESAIEAALRGIVLPDSAIDHDCLMYQAGWAAAMAESAESDRQLTAAASTKRARFWPALAMTFAASTAACLMVILLPPTESGSAVANQDSTPQETIIESIGDEVIELAVDRDQEVVKPKNRLLASTSLAPQRFGFGQLFGSSVEKLVANRNAQFKRHLAEAASPSLTVFQNRNSERDFKRPKPLTLRSLNSFSL